MPEPTSSPRDGTPHVRGPICGMPILEAKHPEIWEVIRNAPRTAAEAGGAVSFEEVYALLRGDSTPPA